MDLKMISRMNKFLTIGIVLCSLQSANTSNISEQNDNTIIEEQNTFDKISKEFSDIKRFNQSNILTFSNNNFKCWFMSAFQLFVTALNQSEPNDSIRKLILQCLLII